MALHSHSHIASWLSIISKKLISKIRRGPQFITLHYTYVLSLAILASILLYAGGTLDYVDALFLGSGAATQSGLNTIDINKINTFQQSILYLFPLITTPIFINTVVVFIRIYWFEQRFQHIVRESKAGRLQPRRSQANQDLEQKILLTGRPEASGKVSLQDEHLGVESGNSTSQLSSTHDDITKRSLDVPEGKQQTLLKQPSDYVSHASITPQKRANHIVFLEQPTSSSKKERLQTRDGEEPTLSPEKRISLWNLEQPSLKRSSSAPTDSTRLSGPHSVKSKPPPLSCEASTSLTGRGGSPESPVGTTANFVLKKAATTGNVHSNRPAAGSELQQKLQALKSKASSRTLSTPAVDLREVNSWPYLSYVPTLGRNSSFFNLSHEQREELGGIEYRALKTLAHILIFYYVVFHVLGWVILLPWILHSKKYGDVLADAGIGRPWWAFFTAASLFNDLGFTLTPNSMISFQEAVLPVSLGSFLIIIGNTGFPCLLRFMIWMYSKVVPVESKIYEELRFLLDHPRRCFTLLFPGKATWWLFWTLVMFNGIDLIFFIILDLNDETVMALSPGVRILAGWFQATSTRTAGFSVVNIADLRPAMQVSYLIMMYISVFPIAMSVRRTNVFEEKSLGIWGVSTAGAKSQSYVGAHLRRQLSYDMWYIFLGLFIIAIAEGKHIENKNEDAFTSFSILFEIVSAYGTVGLSLGHPDVDTSLAGRFSVVSKLVIIAMQVRGRHRGLPYSLDRAILLPDSHADAEEQRIVDGA